MTDQVLTTTIKTSYDVLWNLQDAQDVLERVMQLRKEILKEQVDPNTDPSEGFLAIQGAALRFHPSKKEEEEEEVLLASSPQKETTNTSFEESEETKLNWSVTEESLWAIAALACICVGPAWRTQIHQRRIMIAKDKERRKEGGGGKSSVSSSPYRSVPLPPPSSSVNPQQPVTSPISMQTQNDGSTEDDDYSILLPSIPEVLPAAMLRYASSVLLLLPDRIKSNEYRNEEEKRIWEERKRNIAVAQRYLVLALCCESPNIRKDFGNNQSVEEEEEQEDDDDDESSTNKTSSRKTIKGPKGTDWTIVGANELIGDMIMFWLTLVKPYFKSNEGQGWVDWWYILQVTKASTDLVSTGWRPLAKQNIGHSLVHSLLEVAEKGISLLDTRSVMVEHSGLEIGRSKEERLAASASAAEAISTLASLGSRGLIPLELQQMACRKIIRLHVVSGLIKASKAGIFPLGIRQQEQKQPEEDPVESSEAERQIFMAQIESCFTDTADFFWILFATTSSSANAISSFFSIINAANPKSPTCSIYNSNEWDTGKNLICVEAGTAIRLISAALWRRGPMSTPHLRANMRHILDLLREIANSIHADVSQRMKEGGDRFVLHSTCDMLTLALDTVVSLGNFTDRQLMGGADFVSEFEWDIFISAIQETFVPWFNYTTFISTLTISESDLIDVLEALQSILERAHLELESLVLRLGACLDKFVRVSGSPFHSLVGYDSQKRLYLFILRIAAPRMEATDAKLLGLSVFRAWFRLGRSPFDIEESVRDILLEGFSVDKSGKYIHSPRVRLEALRALDNREQSESTSEINSVPSASDGSGISLASSLSSALDRNESFSPITTLVIPILKEILSKNKKIDTSWQRVLLRPENLRQYNQFQDPSLKPSALSPAENLFALEAFALRLLGKLIRHANCKKETRAVLLALLTSVALGSEWNMFHSNDRKEQDMTERFLQIQQDMKRSIRLAAIRELDSCLIAPFVDRTMIHEIIPRVLECFCTILTTCTDAPDSDYKDEWQYERSILAFASLFSLCRLKPTCEGKKIALVPIGRMLNFLPDFLLPLVIRKISSREKYQEAQIARFLEITYRESRYPPTKQSKNKRNVTMIEFGPIISSITSALGCTRRARDNTKQEICTLLKSFGSLCFHTLAQVLLSGFQVSDPVLLDDVIFASGIETCAESKEELLARSNMLAALTESTVARYISQMSSLNKIDLSSQRKRVDSLFNLLLYVCDSTRNAESIVGCRAVLATLPSLIFIDQIEDNKNRISNIFSRISNRLQREIVFLDRTTSVDHEALVIQELTVLLSILHDIVIDLGNGVTNDEVLIFFELCREIVQKLIEKPPSFCLYLAIQCMVRAIGRLPNSSIQSIVKNTDSSLFEATNNLSEETSMSSQVFDLSIDFVGLLVSELLNVKLHQIYKVEEVPYHEHLALELDRMDCFEVERSDSSPASSKAVFLCGDCLLLTYRVGSSKSRYRGWVEVVVRTPTFRKRLMVRLLSKFSVRDPETASLLWKSHDSEYISDVPTPNFVINDSSASILAKYNSLIQKFDSLIPPTYQNDQSSTASVTDRSGSQPLHRIDSDSLFSAITNETASGRQWSQNMDSRDRHDDKRDVEMSMLGWMREVLDCDSNVKDVEHALEHKLKLPDYLLQQSFDDKTYQKTAYGRSLYPVRLLNSGSNLDRAISVLDRTTPANTHKVALLYAGPTADESHENDPEAILLSVKHCSPTFHTFAEGLGKLVPTKQLRYFSGGLDVSEYESDGRYTRVWIENEESNVYAAKNIVVYHIAHLMPPGINNRKRHVGNDNVLIIFLENDPAVAVDIDLSEDRLKDSVVSGHYGFVIIYVSIASSRADLTRVTVLIRENVPEPLREVLLNFAGTTLLHTSVAPSYVRGLAIRLDMACRSVHENLAPASNCHERYRMVRDMRRFCV